MKRNEVCSFIYDKLKESFQPYSKIIKDEPHTEWVFTEGSINYRFPLHDPQRGKEDIGPLIDILSSSLMGSFVRLIWTSSTEEHTIDVHASHNSNVNYFQVSESSKLISSENPENTQCKLKALSLFPMDDIENSSFKFHITSLYLDENWNPKCIDMNVDQLIKKYSTETNEESLLCKKLEIHYNKDTFCEAIRHLDGGIDKGDFLQGQLPFVDAIKWSLDFALKLEPKYPIVFGHRAKKHPAMDDLNVMASLYEKKWKELCQQMKVSCQESKPL